MNAVISALGEQCKRITALRQAEWDAAKAAMNANAPDGLISIPFIRQ